MKAIYRGVVHPWLCDSMGHLSSRHYLGMFDDAAYHLMADAIGWFPGSKAWAGKGWADIRQEIDYRAEVSPGALIEIEGAIAGIGNSSVTTYFEMKNRGNGKVAATLKSKSVYFDLRKRCSVPLSTEMRKRLEGAMRA